MKISVALCTFNGEAFIEDQINSILSQERKVDQIIICDDNSSDRTVHKIVSLYQNETRIKVFRNSQKLGVIKNFEKAINLCENGIVLLSDQDDIWEPSKTSEIINYFQQNSDKMAVFHNLKLLKNNDISDFSIWDYLLFDENIRSFSNKQLIKYVFAVDNVVTGAALAFRKVKSFTFSNKVDFMLHDFQLFLYFAIQDQLGIINKSLGYYRIHENQKVGAKFEENKYISNRKYKFLSKNPLEKMDAFDIAINRNKLYIDKADFILNVNKLLVEELTDIKKAFLCTKSFFKRKIILYSWVRRKKYSTTIKELILK